MGTVYLLEKEKINELGRRLGVENHDLAMTCG